MELTATNLPSHMPMSSVKTFDDALVSEYAEQMSPSYVGKTARGFSPGLTNMGDTVNYAAVDAATEATFPYTVDHGGASKGGCGSKQKQNISIEYKVLIALVLVVGLFMVVSHVHLSRLRRN